MSSQSNSLPEPSHNLPGPTAGVVPALTGAGSRPLAPAGYRGGPPALPPGLAQGPDLPGLLKALRRRWMIALSLSLVLATAAGAAVWCFLSPSQTAFAQLHVASREQAIVFGDDQKGRSDFSTYQKYQASRVKSRFVLSAALKRDEVKALPLVQAQNEPLLWLEDLITVEIPENSEIMVVKAIGPEPEPLRILVKNVVDAYLKEVIDAERSQRSSHLAKLEEIFTKSNEKLRLKRETFSKLANELGTPDKEALTTKQVTLLSYLSEFRRQHSQVGFELLHSQGRLKNHEARAKEVAELPLPESIINDYVSQDPIAKQHQLKMSQLQDVIDHFKFAARVPHNEPTYVQAEKQLEIVKTSHETRKEELRAEASTRFKERTKLEYQGELARLQNEVALLTDQEKPLKAQVDELAEKLNRTERSTTELEMLRGDIARDDKMVTRFGDEREQLQVELQRVPRVRLLQEAGLQKKDAKKVMVLMLMAPLSAIGAVCFGVAWLEFRARRIQTPDEVVAGLGMRLVGAVPAVAHPEKISGSDEEPTPDELCLQESVDGIRTLLLKAASVEATRVVMVTSAAAGEGKTTLATQLASSLARAGRKTLLVDGDLRRPAVHQLFEQPLVPGFSEVLLREVHLAEATRSTPVEGLWMIPAGQWDREVMQALARDGVEEFFDKLRGEYDFVIVDSHPVLGAPDSLVIGQHVDAVLLSLLRDVSQAPRVYGAGQRLASLGIRVLGAVVHGLPEEDLAAGCPPAFRLSA